MALLSWEVVRVDNGLSHQEFVPTESGVLTARGIHVSATSLVSGLADGGGAASSDDKSSWLRDRPPTVRAGSAVLSSFRTNPIYESEGAATPTPGGAGTPTRTSSRLFATPATGPGGAAASGSHGHRAAAARGTPPPVPATVREQWLAEEESAAGDDDASLDAAEAAELAEAEAEDEAALREYETRLSAALGVPLLALPRRFSGASVLRSAARAARAKEAKDAASAPKASRRDSAAAARSSARLLAAAAAEDAASAGGPSDALPLLLSPRLRAFERVMAARLWWRRLDSTPSSAASDPTAAPTTPNPFSPTPPPPARLADLALGSAAPILFVFFLPVLCTCLQAFNCVPVDLGSGASALRPLSTPARGLWLLPDTSVACFSGPHLRLAAPAGALGLAALAALSLLAARAVLRAARRGLLHGPSGPPPRASARLGFFFLGFKPSAHLWEAAVLLRKALLACVVAFLSPARLSPLSSPTLALQAQLLIALAALLAALALHAARRPFRSPRLHRLEAASLCGSILTCYLGLFLAEGASRPVSLALSALLAAYHVAAAAVALALLADGVAACALLAAFRRRRSAAFGGAFSSADGGEDDALKWLGFWATAWGAGDQSGASRAYATASASKRVRSAAWGGGSFFTSLESAEEDGEGEEHPPAAALLLRWLAEETWPRVGHHTRARGAPLRLRIARELTAVAVWAAARLAGGSAVPPPLRTLGATRFALAARRRALVRAYNARELCRRGVLFAAWAAHGLLSPDTLDDALAFEARPACGTLSPVPFARASSRLSVIRFISSEPLPCPPPSRAEGASRRLQRWRPSSPPLRSSRRPARPSARSRGPPSSRRSPPPPLPRRTGGLRAPSGPPSRTAAGRRAATSSRGGSRQRRRRRIARP